jgi:hypothetical protein
MSDNTIQSVRTRASRLGESFADEARRGTRHATIARPMSSLEFAGWVPLAALLSYSSRMVLRGSVAAWDAIGARIANLPDPRTQYAVNGAYSSEVIPEGPADSGRRRAETFRNATTGHMTRRVNQLGYLP